MNSDEPSELSRISTEINSYLQQAKRDITEIRLIHVEEKSAKQMAKSALDESELRHFLLSVSPKLYSPLANDIQASILMKSSESLKSVNRRAVKMLITDKSGFKRLCKSGSDGRMRLMVNIFAGVMCYVYVEGDTVTILTHSDIIYIDGQYTILPETKRRGTV